MKTNLIAAGDGQTKINPPQFDQVTAQNLKLHPLTSARIMCKRQRKLGLEMTKLVEIAVGKSSVLVEVAQTESGRAVAMTAGDRTTEHIVQSLDKSLGAVVDIAGMINGVIEKTAARSAEVSLGLKFTAKGSLFVAESSAEATLNFKLTYTKP